MGERRDSAELKEMHQTSSNMDTPNVITGKRKGRSSDNTSGLSPDEKVAKIHESEDEEQDKGNDTAFIRDVNNVEDENEDNDKNRENEGDDGENDSDRSLDMMMVDFEEKMAEKEHVMDEATIGALDRKMSDIIKAMSFASTTVAELKQELESMKKIIKKQDHLEAEMALIKRENRELKEKLNDMENYSRRENMEIIGVAETKDESVRDICRDLFKEKLGIQREVDIVRCHRLGQRERANQKPRKILVRFGKFPDKEEIMKKKRLLKGSGIFLSDNLSIESQTKQTALVPVLKKVQEVEPKAHFRGDKIFLRGRLYSEKNIHDLPIDPHQACTKSKDGVTVFSGKFSKLSNMNRCCITLDGRSWTSVEQYIQFHRALYHGAPRIAAQIAATEDPYDAIHLGKTIEADSSWNNRAEEIMEKALRVKFSSPAYKLALRQTEAVIGESTRNKEWGTGYAITHEHAFKPRMWSGKNMTGKLLSKVKSTI
jgi:ribA/ribD-fused uncharacterized protein